jgi:exopolyphosphatase/guanosine-5'-triphosphate,3'-diphosphate pyrophosphatase
VLLAVVDIGTNSTRLLIAGVGSDGTVDERVRRSQVTRLGEGVDATGRLAPAALERTEAVLSQYTALIAEHGCAANRAILTSAVRDATNGQEFVEHVRNRFGLDARLLSGEEEALLTFQGAVYGRNLPGPVAVIDVGGGSTEVVVGIDGKVTFHHSLQAGVVRMSERHLHHDPPTPQELASLQADVQETLQRGLAGCPRSGLSGAIAVAGTATSAAAILQRLDPYDPTRVEGYPVPLADLERIGRELAALPLEQRREVAGLHPDRAPTIVAGIVLLAETLRFLGVGGFEASEHDIMYGTLLNLHRETPQKAVSIEHPSRVFRPRS